MLQQKEELPVVRWLQKDFWYPRILPKKEWMSFLGEFKDTKKSFWTYLTFKEIWFSTWNSFLLVHTNKHLNPVPPKIHHVIYFDSDKKYPRGEWSFRQSHKSAFVNGARLSNKMYLLLNNYARGRSDLLWTLKR